MNSFPFTPSRPVTSSCFERTATDVMSFARAAYMSINRRARWACFVHVLRHVRTLQSIYVVDPGGYWETRRAEALQTAQHLLNTLGPQFFEDVSCVNTSLPEEDIIALRKKSVLC